MFNNFSLIVSKLGLDFPDFSEIKFLFVNRQWGIVEKNYLYEFVKWVIFILQLPDNIYLYLKF